MNQLNFRSFSSRLASAGLCALLFLSSGAQAANPLDELAHNARFSMDFSTRVIDSMGKTWTQQAIGIDYHKVFSAERGDVGVLTLQPFVVRIDDAPMVPGIFDDNHDQALQWRIANFNYTGLAQGRFNIRVGHMEVPFGLEHVIGTTNGTLHQFNAPKVAGLKADWGVSINGVLPWFEYEIAKTQGSGNEFNDSAEGLVAGRIGLPRDGLWWLGVSGLEGAVERGPNEVDQQRWALDAGIRLPRGFNLLMEYAQGEDGVADVQHQLFELNWHTPTENTFVYTQWRASESEVVGATARSRNLHVGFRYMPDNHFIASMELRHHLDAENHDVTGLMQLRYRL